MPFIPTSKLQVSGYKFLVTRLNHALTRFETSMRHDRDPARGTALGQMIGVAFISLVAIGCVAMAYFKPQGLGNGAQIVQARDSAQLFVTIDDKLHPVLNLVSAQLITGTAGKPTPVKAKEVQSRPRGPLVGIPGAPAEVVQPAATDSLWTVCDVVDHPDTTHPGNHTAVIAGASQSVLTADPGSARIVQGPDQATWLLNDGVRRRIDVGDTALILGLGLQRFPRIDIISRDLFNAVPAARQIGSPVIPEAGTPSPYPVAPGVVVGSVLRVPQADSVTWYVVLVEGLQEIPEVMASVIRNTNTFGASVAPTVSQDVVAKLPSAAAGLDTSVFPEKPLHSAATVTQPVTCWQWVKRAGEQQSSSSLTFMAGLPLNDEQRVLWRHDLVSRPGVSMYSPPGSGYFVQTTGSDPLSPARETQWWVSDAGVRYGLMVAADSGKSAAAALGLSMPIQAPWPALAVLASGPGLSKEAALISQDTVSPSPLASALSGGNPPK